MWDIKLKVTNKLTRKTNKQKLIDIGNNMVVTREKGVGKVVVKGKGGQIHGDRKRFDFG